MTRGESGPRTSETQRGVREVFRRKYNPDAYIQPETVARMIISVLETPADARLTDITIGLSPEGQAS